VTEGDELNSTGWPEVKEKFADSRCIQGTIAAAEAFRHVRHWQVALTSGSPAMRYRTARHRHPPSMLDELTMHLLTQSRLPRNLQTAIEFFQGGSLRGPQRRRSSEGRTDSVDSFRFAKILPG
jgi:hypothetical protein